MIDFSLPASTERVVRHTPRHLDRRLHRDMEHRVRFYSRHPDRIEARLDELDHEWDMERMLETNASSLAVAGLALSLLDRRFLAVPLVVAGFLLQHALQGWCPPINLFRRMGFRTRTEIEAERYALKAIRGDFRGLGGIGDEAFGGGGQRAHLALTAVEY